MCLRMGGSELFEAGEEGKKWGRGGFSVCAIGLQVPLLLIPEGKKVVRVS